jgi:hypothetical protein
MAHAMDISGARRRNHEPTLVRPKLGLGGLESTPRLTGTTCRAASLDGSDWSVERDAGRARLDRRRTGPGRTTIQDVPLDEWSRNRVPTDNGNGTFPQRFILSYERIESNQARSNFRTYYDECIRYNRTLMRRAMQRSKT